MDYSPTNKPNVQTEVRQQMTTYSDTVTIGDAARNILLRTTSSLLSPTVGDLRQRLHLTAPLPQPTLRDHIAFVTLAGTNALTLVLSLAAVLAPVVGLAMLIF